MRRMAETSTQEQMSQTNVHPMASGATTMPPSYTQPQQFPVQQALPIQYIPAPGAKSSPVATITMGKLSLFAITLSIMLLGSLTFLAGFLLGLWFYTPAPTP